jgi:hypothetical protein
MSKIWEYNGYTIDEGLKPKDENYKEDYYQYFFLVKHHDRRVMKYCVWGPREGLEELAEIKAHISSGGRVGDYLREAGLKRVKERVESGEFDNLMLEFTPDGPRELALDKLPEKKI